MTNIELVMETLELCRVIIMEPLEGENNREMGKFFHPHHAI